MAAKPASPTLSVAHDAAWRNDATLNPDMRAIKEALGRVEAERDADMAAQSRANRESQAKSLAESRARIEWEAARLAEQKIRAEEGATAAVQRSAPFTISIRTRPDFSKFSLRVDAGHQSASDVTVLAVDPQRVKNAGAASSGKN